MFYEEPTPAAIFGIGAYYVRLLSFYFKGIIIFALDVDLRLLYITNLSYVIDLACLIKISGTHSAPCLIVPHFPLLTL